MSSTSTTWTVDTETTGSVLTTRLSGDVTLSSGDKLYLDGGTHTYFTEASNDIVRLAGGLQTEEDASTSVRLINMTPKSLAGYGNTVYGQDAGSNLDSGSTANTYFGGKAGDATHSNADENTGMGYLALSKLTTGNGNTAIGRGSMYEATLALYNTAVGTHSLDADSRGTKSVAIGYSALTAQNFNGSDDGGNVESRNVAIGFGAGGAITIGKQNVVIGYLAGNDITTGKENIVIGHQAETSAVGTDNEIVVGHNLTGPGANKTVIGNSDCTDVYLSSDQGAAVWLEHINMLERSSDPTEPAEGHAVVWMSNGSGKGDDGDIMIASQAGGATKYATLFDHSGGSSW